MANHGKYYTAIRILLLKQYLEANAGGNRVVKRSELEEHLRKHDISVEKKTLYADFATLGSVFGMQLEYDPHKKGYRLLNPTFELHDLRVMIDCVQAASFITEEEANTVTTKIKGLAPQRERNALSRYVEVRDRVQRAEDSVLRKVDIIQTAFKMNVKSAFVISNTSPNVAIIKNTTKPKMAMNISPFTHGNWYLKTTAIFWSISLTMAVRSTTRFFRHALKLSAWKTLRFWGNHEKKQICAATHGQEN